MGCKKDITINAKLLGTVQPKVQDLCRKALFEEDMDKNKNITIYKPPANANSLKLGW